MRFVALTALATLSLLAACNQSEDGNTALADANASGAEASNAVENAIEEAAGTPLQKEQALALMKERHENYEKIGDAMKAIGRDLKGDSPDLAQVRRNADVIASLAPQDREDGRPFGRQCQGRDLAEAGRLRGQGSRSGAGGPRFPNRDAGQ